MATNIAEAKSHLKAILVQAIPSDDKIIIDHVTQAYLCLGGNLDDFLKIRPFKLPDELLGGAVKVIHPTDLRNRVGRYMVEEHGLHIGNKVDAGKVQDMIEEFAKREIERVAAPA